MPNSPNYLLIDKDKTLGYFPNPGIYPLVAEFLKQLHDQNHQLVIASTAKTENTKRDLQQFDHLIHAYLCREHFRIQDSLGLQIKDFFIDNEGNIKEQPNHQPMIRYTNPYAQEYIFKDLHLARRYLNPKEYHKLRTVMIGDEDDGNFTPASDPYTPVIVINNQQRSGHWQPVTNLVNILFENEEQFPCEQFNQIYFLGEKRIDKRIAHDIEPTKISTIRLYNQTYELDRISNGKRIIITEE